MFPCFVSINIIDIDIEPLIRFDQRSVWKAVRKIINEQKSLIIIVENNRNIHMYIETRATDRWESTRSLEKSREPIEANNKLANDPSPPFPPLDSKFCLEGREDHGPIIERHGTETPFWPSDLRIFISIPNSTWRALDPENFGRNYLQSTGSI